MAEAAQSRDQVLDKAVKEALDKSALYFTGEIHGLISALPFPAA